MRLAVVATAALNQWALDFDGNAARTAASVEQARAAGARYRVRKRREGEGDGCWLLAALAKTEGTRCRRRTQNAKRKTQNADAVAV